MITDTAPLVVGVDGSDRSRDALALAARLANDAQDVLMVHVHPYGPLSTLVPDSEYETLVRGVAESTLAAVQDTLGPDVRRELRLVSDASPAAGVQAVAEQAGASLIVMGSSHRSGLNRVFAGSIAESVLTGAIVPVAIAPHGYATRDARLETVACGFDGSPESHEALAWAHSFARGRRARLCALAVHSRIAFGGIPTTGALGFESANDALRAALEQQMREALASLDDDREVSGRVLKGDAAAELAAASADVDLLVVGSRGYGPVRSVLLGSVSRELVRSAACPVVVLPRGVAGTSPPTS
jgi:nucleotide-binding universal stress UspA family protein